MTFFVRAWREYVRGNPTVPWAALFLFLSLLVPQSGGTNASSRIAALRAATEAHTLHIDGYRSWTIDWARSPNGHYYSNKPPGAFFLGLPVFALADMVQQATHPAQDGGRGRMPPPGLAHQVLLVLTVQLLPFALLVVAISRHLLSVGTPVAGVHFFALAALFGNTAALYMNSYFGHGLSALLFLAALLCWLQRAWLYSGALLSWCLLNDYGVVFLLPSFAFATVWRERSLRPCVPLFVGALPAAFLWCWYHTVAFGSPVTLPSAFVNPEVVHPIRTGSGLWASYSFVPVPELLWRVLFGPERGVLPTQPWVLFAIPLLVLYAWDRTRMAGAVLLIGGLGGLLWMNAGFGGWHGGGTLGPRYLSLVFPGFALMLAFLWSRLPPPARFLLWGGLAVALVFRWLVFPFDSVMVPIEPLWRYHWSLLGGAGSLAYARLASATIATAITCGWSIWASRNVVPKTTSVRQQPSGPEQPPHRALPATVRE